MIARERMTKDERRRAKRAGAITGGAVAVATLLSIAILPDLPAIVRDFKHSGLFYGLLMITGCAAAIGAIVGAMGAVLGDAVRAACAGAAIAVMSIMLLPIMVCGLALLRSPEVCWSTLWLLGAGGLAGGAGAIVGRSQGRVRRLQFSLQELIVLMVLCSLIFAFAGDVFRHGSWSP
jgi:hypothetical protein